MRCRRAAPLLCEYRRCVNGDCRLRDTSSTSHHAKFPMRKTARRHAVLVAYASTPLRLPCRGLRVVSGSRGDFLHPGGGLTPEVPAARTAVKACGVVPLRFGKPKWGLLNWLSMRRAERLLRRGNA